MINEIPFEEHVQLNNFVQNMNIDATSTTTLTEKKKSKSYTLKDIFQKLFEKDDDNDSPMSSNGLSQKIQINAIDISTQEINLQETSMSCTSPSSSKPLQDRFPSSPLSFTSNDEIPQGLSINQLKTSSIIYPIPFHDSQILDPIPLCPSSPSNYILKNLTQSPFPSCPYIDTYSKSPIHVGFYNPCKNYDVMSI